MRQCCALTVPFGSKTQPRLAALAQIVAVLSILLAAAAAGAAEVYVAAGGDDSHAGTRDRPLKTIQRALDGVRPGDTVIIRAGTYRESVRLTASGTETAPIRIMAMPGEEVVLSGADPLDLKWEKVNGAIYRARTDKRFHQLFLDGRMMVEARWPDQRFPDQVWEKAVWAEAGEGSRYGLMVDAALAETGIDFTGCVATLNVGSFRTYRRLVRNHAAGRDRFEYRQEMGVHVPPKRRWAGFDRYWLLGPLAALDAPGEWHLDRDTGVVHLWTPAGTSPAEARVTVKQRDYAVEVEKADYVVLAGFHFLAATFRLQQCNHCIVRDCHLRYPAWPAGLAPPAETLIFGTRNVMRGSSSVFGDGSAVTVRGERNTVENCLFHDFDFTALGRGHAVGMAGSARSTARHCTVYHFGSSEGICAAGKGPSEVAYNYVHHGGLCQSDGGLMQCSGIRQAGTSIHHNWVHDHNAFNWGGNGIRGDDLTRDLLIHHNVVWNCSQKGIIVKGDRNRVYNNTCFDNPTIDLLLWSSPTPRKSFRPRQWDHLLEQQNAHSEAFNNYAPVLTGQMPHEIRRAKQLEPPAGTLSHNYQPPQTMLLDPKQLTMRDDRRLLADPARYDFRPKKGSPLIDAGRQIPGITDGFSGRAPDIGAYEYGAERWVPGYRNALWVLPDAAGNRGRVRALLTMPTLAPVTVTVSGGAPGIAVSPVRLTLQRHSGISRGGSPDPPRVKGRLRSRAAGTETRRARSGPVVLTFTPADWARPQALTVTGGDAPAVRFAIADLGLDATVKLGDLDPLEGVRLPFRTIP
jgi:hypothetical protein